MTDPDSSDSRRRLLADTFQDSWNEGPAAGMAQRAAAHARRRRRQRKAVVGSSLLAAAFVLVWSLRHPQPTRQDTPVQATAAPSPAYEIISDDEMQALLADRPVLVLPRENHAPQIVLLDR